MTIDHFTHEEWIPTIIVIDDDITSSIILENLLSKEGFSILHAENGPDGRGLIKKHKPDLIILDINMPGENGLETCRLLKEEAGIRDIPLIFLTAAEDIETKLKGFKAGALDYITKPFYPIEVLARVRVHIRMQRTFASIIQSQIEQINKLAVTQKMIMPDPKDNPDARYAVYYSPLREAGGDFYDVIHVADGIYDFIVADICDHDLSSSLLTSALKALIHQGRLTLSSPMETLAMINKILFSAFSDDKYLSLVYARLNRQRKTLTTISAGHPPIILLSNEVNSIKIMPSTGDLLGAFEHILLTENQISINAKDRFFIYTDGFIEHKGISREDGISILSGHIQSFRHETLSEMVSKIANQIFSPGKVKTDDSLLLGVEV